MLYDRLPLSKVIKSKFVITSNTLYSIGVQVIVLVQLVVYQPRPLITIHNRVSI
jgi:hypothetical protein